MSTCIRVAAVQAEPVWLDLEATTDKTIAIIADAAADGAELVAFPETWLPGFPVFLFGMPVYEQTELVRTYIANSPTVDGPQIGRIRAAAREQGIIVALGISERDHGSLYMSQLVIGEDGDILMHRRKLKPTHAERSLFGEGDGTSLRVIETPLGRLGALNCFEHLQPLTKFALFAQHEEIHIAGWPCIGIMGEHNTLGAETTLMASRQYALEGSTFVLVATQIMTDAGAQRFAASNGSPFPLYTGGGGLARVYGPDGGLLTKPLDPYADGLVVADIDLSDIGLAKNIVDPVGHYARPDVLRLLVDATPRSVVLDATTITSPASTQIDADPAALKVENDD
ncbi:MAG: carbon-nitrogen hydrolase family protein [Nocardioides sp.]|uniref:carbon-nitrogen hydrolase family protein n=1 Tax=Nocardioides sp. TaxID=35761 RepID=UPI0039E28E93